MEIGNWSGVRQFWARVDTSGVCWVWTGAKNSGGYGDIRYDGRKVGTHRVAWELTNGPIPNGLWVLHRCDNPPCVRPDHLFLGTNTDNMRDRASKGRTNQRKGEKSPHAKLTWASVREMRQRRQDGVRVIDLASEYGVAQSTVSELLAGGTWREVTI